MRAVAAVVALVLPDARSRVVALATLMVAAGLAGCVAPLGDDVTGTLGADPRVDVAAPSLDAAALLSDVKLFSESFPVRRGDNEAHNAARDDLLGRFTAMGYEAFFDEFEAPVNPLSTPTNFAGSGRLINVCAMHWGTSMPEEWIVVGAHYDVTDGAVYGAYDDASGTMYVQHLAAAFAAIPTPRTIVFCNFDGEEQGLMGSGHMVEAMAEAKWIHTNGTAVGMIAFDMAGITYPAPSPLVADVRSPEMKAVIQASAAKLGFPEDKVEYRGISGGSSDNGPFKAAEIPSVLFISAFDEVVVGDVPLPSPVVKYPFWHQFDTYDGMVELAGGEANLEAGFAHVGVIGADLLAFMAGGAPLTFSAEP